VADRHNKLQLVKTVIGNYTELQFPVGKNSQNTAQRRRIAVAFRREKFVFTAKIRRIREKFAKIRKCDVFSPREKFVFTAKIRRICEKFAKIRKCDVFSPFFEKHLFVNFSFFGRKYGHKAKNSQKFASATANRRRICDVASPAQMRRRFAGENASHCEEFAKIRKCDGVTPSQAKTRRKYGENASQMRILRRNLAHFGRICEDFAPRIFRKCDAFATSDRRRKCADFAKKNSQCDGFAPANRRRKSVALRKIPKIFQNFQNFGYIFLIFSIFSIFGYSSHTVTYNYLNFIYKLQLSYSYI